jgi:transposase InsO family protein
MPSRDHPGWDRALYRYAAVSQVQSLVLGGLSLAEAVQRAASQDFVDASGRPRRPPRSSLYRWYRDYKAQGLDALFDERRLKRGSGLSPDFLRFLAQEKTADPDASIPEVIARAKEKGIVTAKLDRTTVYRAARSLNLPMFRHPKAETTAMRPFEYPYRMQMVLCDGKHFRAGGERLKRVVLFLIDDATRLVLDAFVDTAENPPFFLRAIYQTIATFGYMGACYLDRGPGFKADDTERVFALLGIPLIHGVAGYPPGRGKIEKFNDTAGHQVLRSLAKPGIDPDPRSLELRIRHYLRERYSHHFHEGIKAVPIERFNDADQPLLRLPASEAELRRAFVLSEQRKVRKDNVISWESLIYEVPLGHAGTWITVYRDAISGDLSVLHQGRAVKLFRPDLAANARERRSRTSEAQATAAHPVTTAAELHFNRDYPQIVGPDGGFLEPSLTEGD